jgi:hypothetical protein
MQQRHQSFITLPTVQLLLEEHASQQPTMNLLCGADPCFRSKLATICCVCGITGNAADVRNLAVRTWVTVCIGRLCLPCIAAVGSSW